MEALLSLAVSLLAGGALVGAARSRVTPDDSAAAPPRTSTGGGAPSSPPQQFTFNGKPYTAPPPDVQFLRPDDRLKASTPAGKAFVFTDEDGNLKIHVPQLTLDQANALAQKNAAFSDKQDAEAKAAIAKTLGRVPGVGVVINAFADVAIGGEPLSAEDILKNQKIFQDLAEIVVYNPESRVPIYQQLDPQLQTADANSSDAGNDPGGKKHRDV